MSLLDRSPEPDVSPADWIVADVRPFGTGMLSMLPAGFDAYARVFHPARLRDEPSVRWSSVAAAHGSTFHPMAQFGSLIGTNDYNPISPHPDVWDERPREGSLDLPVARRLADILSAHTGTPGRCWFAVWEGFGQLPLSWTSRPVRVRMPERAMHLFRGPIEEIANSFDDWGGVDDVPRQGRSVGFAYWTGDEPEPEPVTVQEPYQSASLWWPDDRSWCVATDVDLTSTYVGGSRACVDALLADAVLEVREVPSDAAVDWGSDTVNAAPDNPSWSGSAPG